MLPYFDRRFGNAASHSHRFGWEAEKAVDQARKRLAELAGAAPGEVIFTSGATESNNLVLKGVWEAYGSRGNHFVTMATEHRAVLDPLRHLERLEAKLTVIPPCADGLIDLDLLRKAILPETLLVSVMYANNEIGVLQPVAEIGALCRELGVLFHSDAAQALGKVPVQVAAQNIDFLSMTAHKIYGPKGVGALYIRRGLRLAAQMDGGGHESGLRSGTLNVPGIVGFGEACEICAQEMAAEAIRVRGLRDRLLAQIQARLDGVTVNGSMEDRLPGNLNLSFRGIQADALLMSLPDIALSTGSACSSATPEPSHVLQALALSDEALHSSVRFGLGRFNTEQEVDYVAERVATAVNNLRAGGAEQRASLP